MRLKNEYCRSAIKCPWEEGPIKSNIAVEVSVWNLVSLAIIIYGARELRMFYIHIEAFSI